ncbi:signal recognition particle-docking protein FtsY [Mycoplasmoides pirum]|uniref:signal recognition particle-docking protein FtsY n=1 Tax=Mycoplasmoides pirum TaxID=2122 RepID=UPI0004842999|nr:signal recognition particle-docking protein FtsY [Mycoplasmoides pirum]
MKFFDKLFSKYRKKNNVVEQIKEKNEANRIFNTDQSKYDSGLKNSAFSFATAINSLSKKYVKLNDEYFDNLFEIFISMDIGSSSSQKIIDAIKEEIQFQKITDPNLIKEIIIDKLFVYYIQDSKLDTSLNFKEGRSNIFLMVGVNGVGKTTSIGKIAARYKKLNYKILLVAGDTFRAGAIEQLKVWADRIGCDIVVPENEKQDSATVIYQGVKKGVEEKYDLVICDTSGRLQNKINLMNELKKISNVITKFVPNAPHETLLVLDATTGQSGLNQSKAFHELISISGIILTKVDGSSKGGVILAIKDLFNIPVKLIGLGEQLDDLANFDLEKYILGITSNLGLENVE